MTRQTLTLTIVALVSLCSCVVLADDAAADSDTPRSEAARDAKQRYQADLKKLDDKYGASLKRVRDRYVKELDAARKNALSDEDLDEAQRLLAEKVHFREEPPQRWDAVSSGRGLVILYGRYGADLKWIDITDDLRKRIKDARLQINPTLAPLPDPVPCVHKTAVIVYAYDGKLYVSVTRDDEQVDLPPGEALEGALQLQEPDNVPAARRSNPTTAPSADN